MALPLPIRSAIGCLILLCLFGPRSVAQSPGLIIKKSTGAGLAILDPNNDGFSSATSAGFVGSDVDTSKTEIKFRMIKPLNFEPTSDLLRGPNTGYSDLVTTVDSSGFYVYSDGTRLYFRMRMGGFIPGSKGYTVLVDTDARIGYTGASADPGYTAPGNGRAGNPGFEFEISFQTNFRLAIYNVDTPGKVVLKYANTPVSDFSQVSVALSYTSGDPDYFMDFYVPFSQLGINANTPLRFAVTTVVAPQPALGGPMSDIFGFGNINDYMSALTQVVTYQSPVTPSGIQTSAYVPVCTQAPSINAPLVGATSISGSWTRLDATKQNTAKIYLYRNAVLIDSVATTSGAGWTIPVSSVAAGTSFYARAQGAGEGNCFTSSSVIAIKCSGSISARPSAFCVANKGIDGTYPVAGSRVRVYQNVLPGNSGVASFTLYADSAAAPANFSAVTTPFVLHDKTTTPSKFKLDGLNGNGNPGTISNSACTGGSTIDMPANTTLAITAQEPGKCESMPLFTCPNGTLTATPTITSTNLYPGSAITGTAPANSYMRLYVDSALRGVVYADASGNFTFPSPGLSYGSKVELFAQSSATTCVSDAATRTVQGYTTPPVITTDNAGYLTLGATSITGTSAEANNTMVYVYKRVGGTTTLVGSTTVSSGAWTLSSVTATASGEIYVATQQATGFAVSDSSNLAYIPSATTTSCAAFATSGYPANATAVSGTVSPALTNGKVYLYIDGALADSASSVTTSFTINVNTTPFNTIYAGASLALTAKTSGGSEKLGCGSPSAATVTCSTIPTPSFSLSPATIPLYGTTTANIAGAVPGLYYSLIGSPDNGTSYATSLAASGTSLSMPSYAFPAAGTYPLTVRALNIMEGSACSTKATAANLIVSASALPVQLIDFKGSRDQKGLARLEWSAYEDEELISYDIERSSDARAFHRIARISPSNRNGKQTYSFTDADPVPGTVWYRLSMPERGGRTGYSQVVSVSGSGNTPVPSIQPSPFSDRIIITAHASGPENFTVRLIDMSGRICAAREFKADRGASTMMLSELTRLAPGVYVLELLQNGSRIRSERIEKQ